VSAQLLCDFAAHHTAFASIKALSDDLSTAVTALWPVHGSALTVALLFWDLQYHLSSREASCVLVLML
jgi:hypothetical protein